MGQCRWGGENSFHSLPSHLGSFSLPLPQLTGFNSVVWGRETLSQVFPVVGTKDLGKGALYKQYFREVKLTEQPRCPKRRKKRKYNYGSSEGDQRLG